MVYLKERSEDVEVRMGRWLSYAIYSCADLGTETRGMVSYRHMPPSEPVEAACDGWIQSEVPCDGVLYEGGKVSGMWGVPRLLIGQMVIHVTAEFRGLGLEFKVVSELRLVHLYILVAGGVTLD